MNFNIKSSDGSSVVKGESCLTLPLFVNNWILIFENLFFNCIELPILILLKEQYSTSPLSPLERIPSQADNSFS